MSEHFWSRVKNIASTYGTDTIVILGKGPSVDDIDPAVFSNKLVIALNDAERIFPADITIFHADWVQEALRNAGYRSHLYLTSTDLDVADRDVVRVPYHPLTNDGADLMMQRFLSDDLAIEEVMFLTALKVCRFVAGFRQRPQQVYMVGFDFEPELGYAHAIDPPYETDAADKRTATIAMQEFFLVNTLYMLTDSDLEVVHVGNRPFSKMRTAELNATLGAIAPPRAEGAQGVDIVAELTTNHFGDRNRLERLVRSAHAAGADYVKLQKRDVATFYTDEQLSSPYVSPFGDTFGDYRRALELDAEDFAFVDRLCRSLGIGWFVSVLDEPSFKFMMDFDPAMVKIPSTISEHRDYLEFVAGNYRGSLVLSTGMTDELYERWVLEKFSKQDRLYLLHCNSAYPTPMHDCNVGVVRRYHELSKQYARIVPGYSSHDHGWMASALAVAAGARMIEKHVKLGVTEWAHFDAVALDVTTSAFSEFVQAVRNADVIVGSEEKRVTDSEHHKYYPVPQEAGHDRVG